MQVEIVDAIEQRHIYSDKAFDGQIVELVPGRTSCAFVLKMPDGRKIVAEVSEEAFDNYRPSI
jgi:molybdopterin-binding protein